MKHQYRPKSEEFKAEHEIKPQILEKPVVYDGLYDYSKINEILSVELKNKMIHTLYCSCGTISSQSSICPNCKKKGEVCLNLPIEAKTEEYLLTDKYSIEVFSQDYKYNLQNHLTFSFQKTFLSMDRENGEIRVNGEIANFKRKTHFDRFMHTSVFSDLDLFNTYILQRNLLVLDPFSLVEKAIERPRTRLERKYGKRKGVETFRLKEFTTGKMENLPRSIIEKFFDRCFELRGIRYRRGNEFSSNYYMMESGINLLKNPLLQDLPYNRFEEIPEFINEKLYGLDTKDVYSILFHHPSNKVRSLIHQNPILANIQMLFGGIIKDPNNQVKILNIGCTEYTKDDNKLFSIYEDIETGHFNIGMEYLKSLHSDETVLVNRLISSFNSIDKRTIRYIGDIGMMSEKIMRYVPDFKPRNASNFVHLHDELSRLSRRYARGNKEIPLTEEEKTFAKKDGKFEFYLPTQTYELVECGEDLDICVGDYGDRAVNKQCLIVFLRVDGKNEVCMEMRKKEEDEYRIVQAKTYHNDEPEKYNEYIVSYLKENNIAIHTIDLGYENREHAGDGPNWRGILRNFVDRQRDQVIQGRAVINQQAFNDFVAAQNFVVR
jgi:hypothetical protein